VRQRTPETEPDRHELFVSGRPLFPEPRKLLDLPIAENRRLRGFALARVHGTLRLFWTELETRSGSDVELPWALSSADFDAEGSSLHRLP
jgi:hypothetical protein